jgi:deoxyribonuclease V
MRAEELIEVQRELGRARPPLSHPAAWESIGGCFVCFARGPSGPGRAGDEAWAAAATLGEDEAIATATGRAGAAYQAGLLALRELPLLERAVQALPRPPGVLLVDATGRDHPRRAGLALHLGAVLDLPTVGVTHRPLAACGEWPADESGARSPLLLDGELVGYWLRTRRGRRPLAVHAAWRTDPDIAVEVVLAATRGVRTPEPLRRARRAARELRAA